MTVVRTVLITLMLTASFGAADRPPEIPLWPGGAPGSEGKPMKEVVTTSATGELSVAGIHHPSITPYLPTKDKATGLAILVIPGGGHRVLAITHEGYNVAEWLRDRGIAAFVLKHRLAREADSTYRIEVESFADTKRALRLIRSRAAEWGIDPGRVGAIGFSAGGELVSMASTRVETSDAAAADPVERQNSKPSFQALIYPGRSGDIQPTKDSPPVFLAAAYNDRQDISEGLAEAYLRFKRAGVPAELHIYGTGGHGFGQRASNTRPVGQWMARFEEWLAESGFLRRAVTPPSGQAAGPTGFSAAGPVKFREQEIARDFGVGYAVASGDVDGDKKPDIIAISGTELVWFRAPNWEKTVILAAGATTADNVTIAPHDIDGDGRLDIALGAGWTRQNTGTLQWVRQNAPGTTPAWEVFPISAEPTLHRIKWADIDGDRKLELIVAPLHGKGTTNAEGPAARLLVFRPPANPRTDPWPMEVAGEANHIQHNFLPMNIDADPQDELVTASVEGLRSWKRARDGTWTRTVIGEGSPGEVKLGRVGGRRLLATVEPWHGAGVAIYAEKPGAATWTKSVIETALTEGHALGWADFDGDGNEELAVGWRRGKPGLAIYFVDRDGALRSKMMVDDGGMDTEDLIVGDFNGDGRPDIVASGRATRNLKIYWNETPQRRK